MDHVSLKPPGATSNDAEGRIRPAGLVFDTYDVESVFMIHLMLSSLIKTELWPQTFER